MEARDDVVRSYSEEAHRYDQESCWGRSAREIVAGLRLAPGHRVVVDVGCGTGDALAELAARAGPGVRLLGVEPAEKMRARARERSGAEILDGRFEELPLRDGSVDYLYSIFAFHWTTDLQRSVRELDRVLGPDGEMDLFFTGRHTGREFTRKTTPVFMKYLGLRGLLESAGARKHLTLKEAEGLFDGLQVTESYQTFYDTLEGHWGWWISRAAAHFRKIPADQRPECDAAIRDAIASLETPRGIPYTIHLLHVRVRR